MTLEKHVTVSITLNSIPATLVVDTEVCTELHKKSVMLTTCETS